ncbi:MAG: hotdog fold thioesterase [Bacteroidales bacterium]|nr:hotdog fold thioesterase [Bacteroidales bacterium]
MKKSVDVLNQWAEGTLISHLGIKVSEINDERVIGIMPVENKTRQPMGFLHGGATLAFAETLASIGSYAITDPENYNVFGTHVYGTHLSSITSGAVTGEAVLIHKGKNKHLWDCRIICDTTNKLISVVRVSIAIVKK